MHKQGTDEKQGNIAAQSTLLFSQLKQELCVGLMVRVHATESRVGLIYIFTGSVVEQGT